MERIAIVTGANSGMGKAITTELILQNYQVIMACRSQARGQKALEDIKAKTGQENVELILCDLSSLESIKQFIDIFSSKYEQLHLLINNAGVILPKRAETKDGFEMQFGVNHIGHSYLTNGLLSMMKNSSPSRIVNVSSGAHKLGKIDLNNISMKKGYHTFKAYSRSKLANILFTYALSKRLTGTGVTVNCCHPGAVGTSMGVDRETGFGKGLLSFLSLFFLTSEQGAETTLYLATSDEVEGVSGKYYYKCKQVQSSKKSYDAQLAEKLWLITEDSIKKALN